MREIRVILQEINAILAAHGVEPWTVVLTDLQERLEKAIASGNLSLMAEALDDLRQDYGGRGSFNDVFISPEAGHHISRKEVEQVNERLQRLQAYLYQIVAAEIDRPGKS